ncbi:biotin transporter BioY [Allonocardiopsis opalescens]|uniref:Biotin transporter n=1 Tax=Allonocardiopsis opalescens TaxID=1144618 RepID=A0A2T0Q6I9_9ACTN|nr:biotin transporter BioY [Allonocardiopsis opalescens]PRX99446.1 biotin transport system substrate-specific component [Allonocardiopsis opalescens]
MSNAYAEIRRPAVLADLLPGRLVRDIALVVGSAALVGAAAQLAVTIPAISPVPFTMQTFAALAVGATLGFHRALLAMGLYAVAGVAGVPWFADATSGFAFPSFGYVLGMVAAAGLVGWLAGRGGDRSPVRAAGTMVLGNLVVYAIGFPYLMAVTGMGFAAALAAGVLPFLVGDAVKIALAAGVLPSAWALVGRFGGGADDRS